ncbi:MAG: ATP synthase F1 subunit delta [Lachnospiraceae bacterium]|nr:ATP synthase F1 subunit delta [Lachnospiraceae bacterium]
MAKLVSKTYGDALFELATEESKQDVLFEEALGIKELLNENDDFVKMMNHPQITREEKEVIIENVFKGRVSDDMTGFLSLLVTNGRFAELESVLDYFIAKIKEFKKIGIAYVATPLPLSDKQKSDVENKLLATTGYEKMEMNYDIDESLIGGMTIRVGDRVIDSSVKSKLEKLTKELKQVKLNM